MKKEGERRKNRAEEKAGEERAHRPHTQLYLMFTYELGAWILERKQMPMDAWRFEDWFTNEVCEDTAEDRIFIRITEGEINWEKEK